MNGIIAKELIRLLKIIFPANRVTQWMLLVSWIMFTVGCDSSSNENAQTKDQINSDQITLLDPHSQKKYTHDLPLPARLNARTGGDYVIPIKQAQVWMGLEDADGNPLNTTVWGFEYNGEVHSPGPTILTTSNQAIHVQWDNELPYGPHLFPVDRTLHIPDIKKQGAHPIVVHLHGGHNEADSDGNPLAWYTQGYEEQGSDFVKENYLYDNTQDATTLWYHDHVVGMTRLNIYAGLSGFYLVTDENEQKIMTDGVLPSQGDTIEMMFADKLFTDDGALFYPGNRNQPINPVTKQVIEDNWPELSHLDEFFGDFIVVNGMVWPKLDVQPRTYRFRLLNGADSRAFVFRFENDMPFYQVSSDGGLLDKPVQLTELVLSPAERADILVDFSNRAGEKIILRNYGANVSFRGFIQADDPDGLALVYNKGGNLVLSDGHGGIAEPTDPQTTGQVMRFDVADGQQSHQRANMQTNDSNEMIGNLKLTPQTPLREPIQKLGEQDATHVRQVVLFKTNDPYGRELTMLGTPTAGSLFFEDPVTEVIENGATEIWEIYNATTTGHPIHIHLVEFEILDRQLFDGDVTIKRQSLLHTDQMIDGQNLEIKGLTGSPILPQANEQGRKDTVIVLGGQRVRVIAHYDRLGKYVWHCHIVSHEDFDMMRPFEVVDTTLGSQENMK